MSNEATTALLTAIADQPTTQQVLADLDSGYLRWQFDDYTAALVTAEDRVAMVVYPPETSGEQADFEVADWYAERISKATYLETRTATGPAGTASNSYTVRPRCGACGYTGKWTQRLHAEDLRDAHRCDR
jgi:hypothetical protein